MKEAQAAGLSREIREKAGAWDYFAEASYLAQPFWKSSVPDLAPAPRQTVFETVFEARWLLWFRRAGPSTTLDKIVVLRYRFVDAVIA